MSAPPAFGIRKHLTGFVAGDISLKSFRAWFVHALWEVEQHGSDAEAELMYLIENRLAEYSGGHVSEQQLREALRLDTIEGNVSVA